MTPVEAPLDAALHHAAFAILPDRAFLRITESDATRWLNGMVTNSAQGLAPGEGNYNFLLNSQGRIQGEGYLYREHTPGDPAFLLATDATQIEAIQAHLDRFIIMDDVELTPALQDESSLLLLGPDTPALLTSLDLPTPDPLRLVLASSPHGPVHLFTTQTPARFELRAPAATLDAIKAELTAKHIRELQPEALEQLRVLTGAPRYGTDIRDRELPQETGQSQALHFSKGCYLGQEIVERIHSRGQVNRLFTALRLEGSLPTLPAILEKDGKTVGEITSATSVDLPGGSRILALGYVRREAMPLTHTSPAISESTSSGPSASAAAPTAALLSYPGGTASLRSLG